MQRVNNQTLGPGRLARRHPFVDLDNLVTWEYGVEQRFHPAEKVPITGLEPGSRGAWDIRTTEAYGSVLVEDGRFRMWYSCMPDAASYTENADHWLACYAESRDGLHWEKPDLKITGQKRFPGNNLLKFPGPFMSVVRALPGGPAKYLALGSVYPQFPAEPDVWDQTDGFTFHTGGMHLFGSNDGFEWKQLTDRAIVRHGDAATFHADEHRGRYLLYQKVYANHRMIPRRTFIGLESRDGFHWEGYDGYRQWRECFMADDYDDLIAAQRGFQVGEYYGICLHQVGGLYLAISSFFTVGLPLQTRAGQNPNGRCLFRLAFSHDGMHFRHPAGRPAFLELGQPGDFDAGFATSMSNLVEHGDDQLFYYSGGRYAHGWCINPNFSMRRDIALEDQRRMYTMGLARIKRDRFASLSATYKGRVDVEIGPRQGERLLINARCPRGWVRFALAEQRSPLHVEPPKGESLPGFSFDDCVPFTGDAVRHAVQFKNASVGSIPADKSLILRLEIAAGDVYAYEWAEDGR